MKKRLFYLFLLGFIHLSLNGQNPILTKAKVEKAVVYFNAAELTQSAEVNLTKGRNKIIIKNVSHFVNENSIQIYLPNGIHLLSTQYSKQDISEDDIDENSPQVKQIRDSITRFEKELSETKNLKITQHKLIELLDKNQNAVQNNVSELSKWTDFYTSKRNKALNTIDVLSEKERTLDAMLTKLKLELNNSSLGKEKIANGKIILHVMSNIAQKTNFKINYLTQNASWKPSYELHVKNITSPIHMIYKAEIVQNTGVDWKNVKLKLSSGNPNQNHQLSELTPWHLTFFDDSLFEEVVIYSKETAKAKTASYNSISDYVQINENQINTSFDVAIPYDIDSDGKKYSVSLKEMELPTQYQYYTTPKMTQQVYLLAEITDYSPYNLLSGEANVIFENMYVGKTQINPHQIENKLKLSLGKDDKIVVNREKISDKSGIKFLSNYKEQTFTYEISVRNNKKDPIEITLKDQYPLSTDQSISVELLQSSRAEVDKETGMLTWRLKLKPNETQKYRIIYKVKYPKDKQISNL